MEVMSNGARGNVRCRHELLLESPARRRDFQHAKFLESCDGFFDVSERKPESMRNPLSPWFKIMKLYQMENREVVPVGDELKIFEIDGFKRFGFG